MESLTGELDYPMVIVTAAHDGERSGCLVGFHTQCSIDPFRWAVWLSKVNHTHAVAKCSTVLALHFPSGDDVDVAQLFGEETGDDVDKFAQCDWTPGPGGVPLLGRVTSRLIGRVVDTIDDGGDHECFVLADLEQHHESPLRQLGFQQVRDLDAGHPA